MGRPEKALPAKANRTACGTSIGATIAAGRPPHIASLQVASLIMRMCQRSQESDQGFRAPYGDDFADRVTARRNWRLVLPAEAELVNETLHRAGMNSGRSIALEGEGNNDGAHNVRL